MTSLRDDLAKLIEPWAWDLFEECGRNLEHPRLARMAMILERIETAISRADAILQLITTRLTSEEAVMGAAKVMAHLACGDYPDADDLEIARAAIQAAIGRAAHEQ